MAIHYNTMSLVLTKVAVLNFSKTYSDYENPARENINNSLILSITVPHDILMTEHVIETHVVSQTLLL